MLFYTLTLFICHVLESTLLESTFQNLIRDGKISSPQKIGSGGFENCAMKEIQQFMSRLVGSHPIISIYDGLVHPVL